MMKTAKGNHHKNLLCKVFVLILIIHGSRGISSLDFLHSSSPLDDDVAEDDTQSPENEDNPSDYMEELRNQVSGFIRNYFTLNGVMKQIEEMKQEKDKSNDLVSTNNKRIYQQKRRPTVYFHRTARRPSLGINHPKSESAPAKKDAKLMDRNALMDYGLSIDNLHPLFKRESPAYLYRTVRRLSHDLDEPELKNHPNQMDYKKEDEDDDSDFETIVGKKYFQQKRGSSAYLHRTARRLPSDLDEPGLVNRPTKDDKKIGEEDDDNDLKAIVDNNIFNQKRGDTAYLHRTARLFPALEGSRRMEKFLFRTKK